MKKIILLLFISFTIVVSCNQKHTMVDDLNAAQSSKFAIEIETKGINKQGRNLIYLLDPSCSMCIVNYICFLETLGKYDCDFDSLFTIVLNNNYLMNVEYYLKRDSIIPPKTEKYIIDNEGILTEYYNDISNNNNIILVNNSELLYKTTVFAYTFHPKYGLIKKE